jgi:hypothetical protein
MGDISHVPCPECGALDYRTDAVCMSCGASLVRPAPASEPPPEPVRRGPWLGVASLICSLMPGVCLGLLILVVFANEDRYRIPEEVALPLSYLLVGAMPLFAAAGLVLGIVTIRRRHLASGVIATVLSALALLVSALLCFVVFMFTTDRWSLAF